MSKDITSPEPDRVPASKFKEQCLRLLETVTGEGIVITKHGRPIAKLLPYREEVGDLIGCLRGELQILGDTLTTEEAWDAES